MLLHWQRRHPRYVLVHAVMLTAAPPTLLVTLPSASVMPATHCRATIHVQVMLVEDSRHFYMGYSELDSFGSSTVPGHLRINIFVFP